MHVCIDRCRYKYMQTEPPSQMSIDDAAYMYELRKLRAELRPTEWRKEKKPYHGVSPTQFVGVILEDGIRMPAVFVSRALAKRLALDNAARALHTTDS